MARTKKPSNSVGKSTVADGALAILTGWATATIHAKNPTIPLEVIASGFAALGAGVQGFFAWMSRGGRKGETE